MALNTPLLIADLTEFLSNLPPTEAECAERWSSILTDYVLAIVPPVVPGTPEAAGLVLNGALLGMAVPGAALAVFDAAFLAFATTLSAAMLPLPGVPPPVALSVTLAPVMPLNNVPGVTSEAAAAAIATVVDLWFRTGVSSSAVPWS